jgi:hypothetical protein
MNIKEVALKAIEEFYQLSPAQFLDMPPDRRGFICGCIIGNYAAHHPLECFELLHQIRPKS